MEKCCVCDKRFEVKDASSGLGQKGVEKIKLIDSSIDAQVGNRVHIDCRRNLVRPPYVKVSTSVGVSDSTFNVRSRCSQTPNFSPKDNCIFCGEAAKYDGKKKGFVTIPVRTKDFQGSIGSVCRKRNDEWSNVVLSVDWNTRKISMLQIASIIRLAASTSEREKESQSSLVATMKRMPKRRSKDDQ